MIYAFFRILEYTVFVIVDPGRSLSIVITSYINGKGNGGKLVKVRCGHQRGEIGVGAQYGSRPSCLVKIGRMVQRSGCYVVNIHSQFVNGSGEAVAFGITFQTDCDGCRLACLSCWITGYLAVEIIRLGNCRRVSPAGCAGNRTGVIVPLIAYL